ncbi:MAG: glycosyl hydrolase [Planctomycetota bacterium]
MSKRSNICARWVTAIGAGIAALAINPAVSAQSDDRNARGEETNDWFGSLEWRNIGPGRGGRAQAVSGVIGDRDTYYMGVTGGGLWKTTDAGQNWRPISDEYFKTGSVGDVEVAASDPNVVYVGMGEADIRGNFSHGDGVYRSLDAGKTWEHMGLEDTRQIGRLAVHPNDPMTVFVAALGHVWGSNTERGIFKSTDGGETWNKVLYVDENTGGIDVRIDPLNPRVVYAGMWEVSRKPWRMDSGGEGSGLYKSTDGGETWTELTNGIPKGVKGKVSISPSRAQRDLVYAMVEADEGGVFRSDDGGETFRRTNSDRQLRQRAWYYTHIYADPQEADTVYVLNVGFHRSNDGGRTFPDRLRPPHGDNHDMWIDPFDNTRMVESNDGGANVSFDKGASWTDQTGQPTAQFYRVTTDNRFPYRVYGAQQDNSTASVSSRSFAFGNWERDLYAVGGGESGYIAIHPEDDDVIYAGSYGGLMTYYNHDTGVRRNVTVWPENPMGAGADVLEHRFQWTFPIIFSPHDSNKMYVGGERVFVTTDGGASFTAISPDLTTNDKDKQRSSGGLITQDNTAVEYYCTVFTIAESPLQKNLIWAGSDDGLIHVTTNGRDWRNVTPRGMGDWPMISLIEASPHDADTAYAAVNRYKMDDFKPYVYRTTNRGRSWQLVADGIPNGAHVRSVREDPMVEGLLYAGTETGVYVSFNKGNDWEPLNMNLPVVPVTDVTVKDDDLVIATQGRSFWILPGLSVLRQIATTSPSDASPALFAPADTYRSRGYSVATHFYVPESMAGESMTLTYEDADGETIREYKVNVALEGEDTPSRGRRGGDTISAEPGMNGFSWNMRLPNPTDIPGAIHWPGIPPGPRVPPGEYTVTMTAGDDSMSQTFTIHGDPRVETTQAEYEAQFDLLLDIHNAVDTAHTTVNTIQDIRASINDVLERAGKVGSAESLTTMADDIKATLKEVEEAIYQTKSKSSQDPLNFPIRLNDKIGGLAGTVDGDFAPTQQSIDVFNRLKKLLDAEVAKFNKVVEEELPEFNRAVAEQAIPAIVIGEQD